MSEARAKDPGRTGGGRSTPRRLALGAVLWTLVLPFALIPETAATPKSARASSGIREAREVRTVWTSEFGLPRPTGVAYDPSRGELLVAQAGRLSTSVLRLGFAEDARGTFSLPALADPATLAVDPVRGRITGVSARELISAPIAQRPTADRRDISGLGLEDAQGATFDPATGAWFVLDAASRSVVRAPARGGGAGSAARVPLGELRGARLQGIAFNPSDGLLYVGSPDESLIYAVDGSGAVRETFSTASAGLPDPRAMVFAPSSDTTDDPSTMNLFVADAGSADLFGGVTELTLEPLVMALVTEETLSLVQVIDTSEFVPASPDPSGITWMPGPGRLMIADSEVDETTGAGYHGVNMWRLSRSGVVDDTGTTLAYTNEPTGLGYDPGTNTLFVSTDSGTRRVYIVKPGSDGRFGTPDDLVSFINTGEFGNDTEDPEFDPATGHLFFIDGTNAEVYRVDPVDGVFGNGDDVVTSFDVGQYGATDIEGLGSDQSRGTLLVGDRSQRRIYEVTKEGELVRILHASSIPGMTHLSGLTMAPASDGSGRMNIWTVDRGVDNGQDPNENDGKIFELSLEPSDNAIPVVDSVAIDQAAPRTNDTLAVSVVAHDDDGDPLTYSYQWRKNGVTIPGEEGPTLDLSAAGNGDKGDAISVRVVAFDGTALSAPRTSSQVTVVNTFPAFDQDLPDRTNAEGSPVSFSAGASDDDGDTLAYTAEGLPPGVTIDQATGLISGDIAPGAAAGSPYDVTVTVQDFPLEDPGEDPEPAEIALVQSKAGDQSATPGNTFSLDFDTPPTEGNLLVAFGHSSANRVPTIPDGWSLALETGGNAETVVFYRVAGPSEPTTVTYSVSGTDVFMGLAIFEYAGMHDVQSEVLDRTVSGTVTDDTSVSTGTTQVTVEADELLMASVSLNGTRTFSNTWTNGFAQLTDERRQTVAHRIVSETGQFETTESWDVSVGTAIGSMVTFKGAGASGTPTVPDPNPGSATDTFTWTVTASGSNTPPVVDSVVIDQSEPKTNDTLSVTVSAHDDDGNPLSYAYQWIKNGVDLPGETSATLDLSVPGNGDKGDEISVRVIASDGAAESDPVTSSAVTVVNFEPVFGQDLGDRTNTEGDVVNLAVVATDADGDQLTFEATGLPPGLSIDAETGVISGTVGPGASSTSPYAVAVTVRDGPEVDATDTFMWTVTAPDLAPAAPTGLGASLTSVSVVLDWDDGPEPDLAGYNVYRSSNEAGPFTELNAALLTSSSYTDATAPPGATSYYRVTAVDAVAQESEPAETSATRVISFRSSTTATQRSATSLTAAAPAGVTDGDLLLASVMVRGTPTITPPAGWSVIRNDVNGSAMRQVTYFKVAGPGEPPSYTWTFSSMTGAAGVLSAYRGVDPATPIGGSSGQANPSSTSITAPSVQTDADGSLVAGFFGIATNGSITPPSGMIEQAEATQSAGQSKLTGETADEILAQAGHSGSRTAAASSSAANIGHLVALRPLGAPAFEDTETPSTPQNVQASGVSATQVNLVWDPSTDNVGVDHYNIYRDGSLAGTSAFARFSDTGLQADTTYSYTVQAVDAAGNASDLSAPASATTLPTVPEITFQGASSNSVRGPTLTIAKPSGAAPGDVLVASIDIAGAPSVTPPSSWTSIANDASGTAITKATFWHLVGPADPASFSWTFSASSPAAGVIVAYRGVDPVHPIDATDGQTNPSSTSIAAPSVTTVTDGAVLIGFFSTVTNASITPPGGMTERIEVALKGPVKIASEAADQVLGAAGATGGRTAQASKAAVNAGRLVALRPA